MTTMGGAVQVVRAAGGVVSRGGAAGPEVAVVHRGRYDDWSLPKGKLSGGEHPLAAAVREVEEETGIRAVPRLRLPSTRYLTGTPGVEKLVEYWAMRIQSSDGSAPDVFTPNEEVDELRWVPLAHAPALLTYGHDRGVVNSFARLPPVTAVVILVRHAYAGRKGDGPGPDQQRPLDGSGHATAHTLAGLLTLFGPDRIVSATPVRCVQTVEPLAAALSLPVGTDERFDEDADPAGAVDAARALAASGATAVVCSQGKLIPKVLRLLSRRTAERYHTAKGAAWVLGFSGPDLVGAAHLDLRGQHSQD